MGVWNTCVMTELQIRFLSVKFQDPYNFAVKLDDKHQLLLPCNTLYCARSVWGLQNFLQHARKTTYLICTFKKSPLSWYLDFFPFIIFLATIYRGFELHCRGPGKNSSWLFPNFATCCYANHAMFMQNTCHEHDCFRKFMPVKNECLCFWSHKDGLCA